MGLFGRMGVERDRQGVNARYVNNPIVSSNDGIPPSLDVYQFIWDRTRMIRKDFILQNLYWNEWEV